MSLLPFRQSSGYCTQLIEARNTRGRPFFDLPLSYVDRLKSRGMQISMTESGDPLENAVAERVNGIIKSQWLYGVEIKDYADCYERVSQAIETYNNLRPQ